MTTASAVNVHARQGDFLEDRLYRKVFWRLMPLLFFSYIVAYLDRVNVGFAKLQMLSDLHFSEAVYGTGAGIFFIGYFLFEVPSNLILHKVGARRWIARIMISWGVVSGAMVFVNSVPTFYVMRFLLGACEAGFYPGVILYLSSWFPAARRGTILAGFIIAVPVAGVLGGPISGAILAAFNGVGGYAGWKWLFVLEAIPSIFASLFILAYLTDSPQKAAWLTPSEKKIISDAISAEAATVKSHKVGDGFKDPKVWLVSLIYFSIVMGSSGIGFWLPSIIAALGVKDPVEIGLWSAIPNAAGVIGMLVFARSSDRLRERPLHVAAACVLGIIGLVGSVLSGASVGIGMLFLSIAAFGIFAALPIFWTIPPRFLAGAASAAGIALINSIGNLAGFVSPSIVGWVKQSTGSANNGLYIISAFLVLATVLLVTFRKLLSREAH